MNRRHLLGAAAALLAAQGLAGCKQETAVPHGPGRPTVSTKTFSWKMVTAWAKDTPGLSSGAESFARRVAAMSGGRLAITVYAAGERMPAPDALDAVSRGTAQMGHSSPYDWKGRIAAAPFFTAVPFGLSALEMNAWLHNGGGMSLWEEAYAPFGIKPLVVGNTGMRMGGWFNKEINSLDDLEGLRVRMPGIGGEVLNRLRAIAVNLPGHQVLDAMRSGAIDAAGWAGPYGDQALGLPKVARYYYYPGWQEPQAVIELLVNKKAWDRLPADLQAIVEEAARGSTQIMLDEYTYHNARALTELKQQGVEFKRFPEAVLAAMHHESEQVLEQLASQNELNARIWASMKAFREQTGEMHRLTEKALDNWR